MEFIIICLVAFIASGLTLFSGFGLGTLLMPAFAFFFPVEIAISLTAIVHLLNNIFKLFLLGRHADKEVVLKFGLPAIVAAFFGAWLLVLLSGLQPDSWHYSIGGFQAEASPVKVVIALLIIIFTILEILPSFNRLSLDKKWLPVGGLFSGFFGGLSGHQGALRSAFLIKYGLSKEAFIASGVIIACLVDTTRIAMYAGHVFSGNLNEQLSLLIAAVLSAFLGAYIGKGLLKKVTLQIVQIIVSVMLCTIALLLGLGII